MKDSTSEFHILFQNRTEAGRALAHKLKKYKSRDHLDSLEVVELTDAIVLALPRGGVPVAYEIAKALKLELNTVTARKIGVPVFNEVAAGAICEDGEPYFNEHLLVRLGYLPEDLSDTVVKERAVIRRQIQKFRQGEPLKDLTNRTVILVDDGLATGATARAAIRFLNRRRVSKIVLAVPVASARSAEEFEELVDEVVCLAKPENFLAVSQYYVDFKQVKDEEVIQLLQNSRRKRTSENPLAAENTSSTLSYQPGFYALRKVGDLDPLIGAIKDKRIVMLGEASHGTHEYYQLRATISKKLMFDHGFKFIAVEGDWPDAARLNRYIQGYEGESAQQVLMQNHRWPTWMWANTEVAKLAEWMHTHEPLLKVGFYGLDVYSLFDSMAEVDRYLRKKNPALADEFKKRYACFEPYRSDEVSYAKSLFQFPRGCKEEVSENLAAILQLRLDHDDQELFNAQQNALVAKNAEDYYRAMVEGDSNSWNVRDQHMMETLDRLLNRFGENSKAIVWAHNTHIGDYRATNMLIQGQVNIGGLAREKYGVDHVALVRFGSYQGSVVAGSAWGAREEIMSLPPAREDSYDGIFHRLALTTKNPRFYLDLKKLTDEKIPKQSLQRAVGVVYDPDSEYRGNYVRTLLRHRYDHYVFVDHTTALRSLHPYASKKEFPETWPSGQ
jgi:erythromycin esterase-like protein/predicted phosphoribosyltransferase